MEDAIYVLAVLRRSADWFFRGKQGTGYEYPAVLGSGVGVWQEPRRVHG